MSSAAKVGVFMMIVLAILGFFILKIEDVRWNQSSATKKVTAIFDSVAGLDNKSAVRVAGVRVGKVSDIRLRPDGKAEVTLEVDRDVQMHGNASAKISNLGLLGEKYVELDPGTAGTPLVTAENVTLRGSQPASIDDVTNQISAIADDVKAITSSLRSVMAGQQGQQRLDDIVENVRAITAQVRDLIAANRTNVDATLANTRVISEQLRSEIPRLASSIDRVAGSLSGTVNENRSDVREIVENMRKLSAELRQTTDNLNNITGQVKSGEGSVGKLIYSNEAHDKLTAALGSVESGVNELRNTLGRANRIGLDIGIRSELYAGRKSDPTLGDFEGNARSAVDLRLVPNPERNRFFNIQLADDPRGKRRDKITETTVTDPSTGQSTKSIVSETRYDHSFLVSAQAGWSLDKLDVRVGLIDSTGGLGADYRLTDRLRVTGEAFDFSKKRDNQPHVRAYGEYVLRKEKPRTPMIFVSSGIDNPLNKTSFIFGGGIRWKDDDLKYLLSSVPLK